MPETISVANLPNKFKITNPDKCRIEFLLKLIREWSESEHGTHLLCSCGYCGALHKVAGEWEDALTASVKAMDIHPDDKKVMLGNVKFLKERAKAHAALLEAVKLAYRKHHMNDDSIGFDELKDRLRYALCLELGEQVYLEWVESVNE